LAAALRFADVERELDDERLALDDERLDPLDFLDLPPELPLLRRSAISVPLVSRGRMV
jgi:hypothetical protein